MLLRETPADAGRCNGIIRAVCYCSEMEGNRRVRTESSIPFYTGFLRYPDPFQQCRLQIDILLERAESSILFYAGLYVTHQTRFNSP